MDTSLYLYPAQGLHRILLGQVINLLIEAKEKRWRRVLACDYGFVGDRRPSEGGVGVVPVMITSSNIFAILSRRTVEISGYSVFIKPTFPVIRWKMKLYSFDRNIVLKCVNVIPDTCSLLRVHRKHLEA